VGNRRFGNILILLIASASAANAQHHPGVITADTGLVNRIVLLDPGLSLGRAIFLFPPSLRTEQSFRDPFMTTPAGGFLPGGPFMGEAFDPRADLLAPYRLQVKQDKGLNVFQTVLGAMETGAVGYMAYRHIKKYGLFR
jgi:hypothetical protein